MIIIHIIISQKSGVSQAPGRRTVDKGSFALKQQMERLYLDHHKWLTSLLRRKLGNSTDAADLMHDVYLKLIGKGRVPTAAECRCHLTQIAKGMVVDLHRRRRLEASHLETLKDQHEPLAPSEETRALAAESLARIDSILRDQPRAREALLLHRLEGMGHRDIATQLNVSVSSVEKYIASGVRACMSHV